MRKIRHPLSGAIYEVDSDDHVLVTAPDGTSGTFDGLGRWLSGPLRTADGEMCRWVDSGTFPSPRLKTSRRYQGLVLSDLVETAGAG